MTLPLSCKCAVGMCNFDIISYMLDHEYHVAWKKCRGGARQASDSWRTVSSHQQGIHMHSLRVCNIHVYIHTLELQIHVHVHTNHNSLRSLGQHTCTNVDNKFT